MYVGFASNPAGAAEQYRFDFLVFYKEGLAYRGGAGYFTEGPGLLQLDNDTVRRYHLGRYSMSGDEIRIAWGPGKTELIQRQGERLSIRGVLGTPWQRLPSLDGLRLQDTFAPVASTADPVWIAFRADGGFTEQGAVKYAANLPFLEKGLEAPAGGSGTYSIEDYSLILRYRDGQSARMLMYVLPEEDLRRPARFLVNTYFFRRQP